MIRVTERVGKNTYVTTGVIAWFLSAIFAAMLIFALGVVLLVCLAGFGLWQLAKRRWPKVMDNTGVVIGLIFGLGVWLKLCVGIIQAFPSWGGVLTVILLNLALPVGLLLFGAAVADANGLRPGPNGPPEGSVPTSAPPLSGSEQIRQTRGWS